MEAARVRLAEKLDADGDRLAQELGADGDRLDEELDPAPIVLDPEPPPDPRQPLLAFKLLPARRLGCGLCHNNRGRSAWGEAKQEHLFVATPTPRTSPPLPFLRW